MRREVLRLVDDDVLIGNAPAADVGQRLDGDEPQIDELFVAAPRLLVGARKPHEEFDVVVDRLHPWVELLFHAAGQVPDVLAEREHRARDQHLLIDLLLHRLLQPSGDGEQRLAGARLAHDGDQLDLLVQQQVEREALLFVPRPQSPGALLERLHQRNELAFGGVVLG